MDEIRRSHTPSDIGFTVIINSVIEDERLSATALAILIYLLSKPPEWKIQMADVKRRFSCGRDKVHAAYRELEDARYLVRECVKAQNGRWVWTRTIYDLPQDGKFDQYGHRRGHLKTVDPFKSVGP